MYYFCLQGFEALTPNLLARSMETIEGGGLIIVLLPPKQLASLKMVRAALCVCVTVCVHVFV